LSKFLASFEEQKESSLLICACARGFDDREDTSLFTWAASLASTVRDELSSADVDGLSIFTTSNGKDCSDMGTTSLSEKISRAHPNDSLPIPFSPLHGLTFGITAVEPSLLIAPSASALTVAA
jgi:hypothetical protein